MRIEVVTEAEYLGDIIGDVNRRRGQVTDQGQKGPQATVQGFVPLAEMFGYATAIRSLGVDPARVVVFEDTASGIAAARAAGAGHVVRVAHFCRLLGEAVRMNEEDLDLLFNAAPMHDIGKIGIPDHILLKPGPLTAEEFDLMRQHTTIGSRSIRHAIARAQGTLGHAFTQATQPESLRYLEVARLIALYHHERWDGQGYPEGLAGEAIPLPARLMAVADVYDALTQERIYKPAWSMASTEAQILAGAGTQFDPAVVQAFDAVRGEMALVMQRLTD